uniref:Uncharacterized protein n=1 Tax=Arundo donax TaxID=35708 RepID=A0A0A9BW74_ARUDO
MNTHMFTKYCSPGAVASCLGSSDSFNIYKYSYISSTGNESFISKRTTGSVR